MKAFVFVTLKRTARFVASGAVGALIVLIVVFVLHLESRPDLEVWHEAWLDEEFTTDKPVKTFADYQALESRLFTQLDTEVFERIKPKDQRQINRYHRGSLSDPGRWPRNWNHTFELTTETPRAGVLLLHGMSDSPYSLRNMGERLHDSGAWVVGLRLPGHGTAPSGLVDMRYEDMVAAVRLAIEHLRDQVKGQPIYIVGYSNGGALAVHYALSAVDDTTLPQVDGLVLISPSIGVTKMAALAIWQARLGHFLGLDKLAWSDILPEYDPFKYGSFAVNAGDQVYRLTNEIHSRFAALDEDEGLKKFPLVLGFQSVVDATVSTRAVVENLFAQLPEAGHELVLFDINRVSEVENVLTSDPKEAINTLLNNPDLGFVVSLVTNRNKSSTDVILRQKMPGRPEITDTPLSMQWPRGLFSLSHVALPISMDDELYGKPNGVDNSALHLGNLDLRGERGVLQIPAAVMLRLRWNPFYPYIEQRTLNFMHLGGIAPDTGDRSERVD
ncbi:MAG: alpha/beta hydrolase [Gammaproteobacteria bacterium]|nr:MAG: alpha/beta hydrolase [Gammaproteobacteria bacterium]